VLTINSAGVVTAVSPGTATVTYSVTTAPNGCSNTINPSISTISITISPTPTVSVNSATICSGQSATLIATPSISGGTYAWTPNGQTTSSISVSPVSTSTYGVVYTVNGCSSAVSSATVTVNSASLVSFEADQVSGCAPLTVNLTSTGVGTSNCIWNLGNGQTLNGCSVTYTFTQGGCYDISLSSSSNGCTGSYSIADYICVEDAPIASFTSNPTIFVQPSETVSFTNTSIGATNYQWNFGDQQSSTDINPVHLYQNTISGMFVELIAFSNLGCVDTAQISIQYSEGEVLYVPNSFTPDGDEYNNTFFPVFTSGFDPYNIEMVIYNRWGELIFETHDISIGWDGTYFNGRKCQDGIYTWKITYKSPSNDKRKVVTGHITLIR
jgi:gliding motility-associated-like protein